jgi:hypothetical protein
VVTNALAKATVALLLARIVFIKSKVQACYLVLAATVLWGIGSFLTVAIRCTDHPPWQIIGNETCPSLVCSLTSFTDGYERMSHVKRR